MEHRKKVLLSIENNVWLKKLIEVVPCHSLSKEKEVLLEMDTIV
jgi:hypothetical protein